VSQSLLMTFLKFAVSLVSFSKSLTKVYKGSYIILMLHFTPKRICLIGERCVQEVQLTVLYIQAKVRPHITIG
jgi:hypothetical protein